MTYAAEIPLKGSAGQIMTDLALRGAVLPELKRGRAITTQLREQVSVLQQLGFEIIEDEDRHNHKKIFQIRKRASNASVASE